MNKVKILFLYPFGGLNPKTSSRVMGLGISKQLINRNFSVYIIPQNIEEKRAGVKLGLNIIDQKPHLLINKILFNLFLIKPFKIHLKVICKIIKVIGGKNGLNKRFKPFSCEIINDKLLAVCGGYSFQIISWQDNEVIFNSEDLGELHGIAYNNRLNLIYLVSRSIGLIYIFKIEI